MSDVGVALDKLKISENDDLPEYEESEIGPEDSASKISASNSSTKEAQTHLLIMAMKRIEVLEAKNEELTEKLAVCGEGSPLKRKKKEGEFNAATWSSRISKTGYFNVGHNKRAFHTNLARFAYINILMEHYKTSDFSKYTLDENLRPLPLVWGVCSMVLLRGIEPHSHPRTESSGVVWGGTLPTCAGSSRWVPRGACGGADPEVLARAGVAQTVRCWLDRVASMRRHPRQSRPRAVTYPVCLRLWCPSMARPQLA